MHGHATLSHKSHKIKNSILLDSIGVDLYGEHIIWYALHGEHIIWYALVQIFYCRFRFMNHFNYLQKKHRSKATTKTLH
jgi:hypothetical protein